MGAQTSQPLACTSSTAAAAAASSAAAQSPSCIADSGVASNMCVEASSFPPLCSAAGHAPSSIDSDLLQLLAMFPNADPLYIESCLKHYETDRVARVAEKIIEGNFSYYPQIVGGEEYPPSSSAEGATSSETSPRPVGATSGLFSDDDDDADDDPASAATSSSKPALRSSGDSPPRGLNFFTRARAWSFSSASGSAAASASASGSPAPESAPRRSPRRRSIPPARSPSAVAAERLRRVRDAATSAATKNMHLRALSALFPDAEAAFLHAMIESHPENTVVGVAETIGMQRVRYRKRKRWGELRTTDLFRSAAYVRGAKYRLFNEFPDLWKTSIKAYLAESNFDYAATRRNLQHMLPAKKSGFFLFNLFKRRPADVPEMYDPELLADVDAGDRDARRADEARDAACARAINYQEYEAAGELVTCGCCYDDVAWEGVAACSGQGRMSEADGADGPPHLVCLQCVGRAAQEAVFGQQGAGLLGAEGLKCLDPSGCSAAYHEHWVRAAFVARQHAQESEAACVASGDPVAKAKPKPNETSGAVSGMLLVRGGWRPFVDKQGFVGQDQAVSEGTTGDAEAPEQAFARYRNKVAWANAMAARLPVRSCPYCDYLEIDTAAQDARHPIRRALTAVRAVARIVLLLISPLVRCGAPPAILQAPADEYDGEDATDGPLAQIEASLRRVLPPRSRPVAVLLGSLQLLALTIILPPALVMTLFVLFAGNAAALCRDGVRRILRPQAGPRERQAAGADARSSSANTATTGAAPLASRVRVLMCKNPACGAASCLTCRAEYFPHHRCYEPAEESLQQYVERAMSNAIKRVCPSCSLAFTKADGCNLMKCPRCRYIMCYVCRKGIKDEKYRHFCQHFRLVPGKCRECTACELYASEDETRVRQAAGAQALEEWLRDNPHHGLDAKAIHAVRASVQR